MRTRPGILAFGLMATALALPGCAANNPPTAHVTGKVIFKNGKPLPKATVQFVPPTGVVGHAAQGTTDDTGSFSLETVFNARDIHEGAVAGKYKVVVIPYPHTAKIDVKYASPVATPLQVEVPESGLAEVKLVVEAGR